MTSSTQVATDASRFLSPPSLMEPFVHVQRLPSKNIRGHFIDALRKLLQLSDRNVLKLSEAAAMLHSASLLIDDIEDGTKLRRGEPAAHEVFGMPLTLNAASSACYAALEMMLQCGDNITESEEDNDDDDGKHDGKHDDGEYDQRQVSQVSPTAVSPALRESSLPSASASAGAASEKTSRGGGSNSNLQQRQQQQLHQQALSGRLTLVFIDAMKLLHSGQGKDIFWRDTHHVPSLAEYRLMARQKTGGLFRLVTMWALELHCYEDQSISGGSSCKMITSPSSCCPARTAEWRTALLSLCDDFGLCFQILDDVANLCDTSLHHLKSFCDDLDEGKFSYPAIHHILLGLEKTPTADTRLMHQLRQQRKPKSDAEKEFCVALMKESGSIRASCEEVLRLCEDLKRRARAVVMVVIGGGDDDSSSSSSIVAAEQMMCGLIDAMAAKAKKFLEMQPCE